MRLPNWNCSCGNKRSRMANRYQQGLEFAKQTRYESFVEAWVNVFIGFWINFAGNLLILPLFGFTTLSLGKNFAIGACFTVISVARQYAIRRWAQDHLREFNRNTATFLRKIFA